MKKLIAIAAMAFCAASSFAGTCGETVDCPFGYRLRIMVRTTNPCTSTLGCSCGETATYRNPAIRKFIGVVYGTCPAVETTNGTCRAVMACGCNKWDSAKISLWDYDTLNPVILDASATELLQLNRVGCEAGSRDKAEMVFTLGMKCSDAAPVATMTFAGFGSCGNHDGNMTLGSMQGYCSGFVPAGRTYGSKGCSESVCTTKGWNMCDNTSFDSDLTAAYGKWTLVWSSDIASKVGSNLTPAVAKTGWGDAVPVALTDARSCGCAD